MGDFTFPLGVYPLEPINPRAGYTVQFEPADGGEGPGDFLGSGGFDDWEEWPDRFVYDVLIPATRLRALCRVLFAMLPGRVYPILDVLGADAYREIDPYLAYELMGVERFYDGVREWDEWLYEDGLVGFGAMSVEPFYYVFVDEHKIVTIRAELAFKERIEKLLSAFDLSVVEELRGADSAEHEHRTVLAPPADPDQLTADDIIERLRDAWGLQLNIDASTNVDDDGNELGCTPWQCIVRCSAGSPEDSPERQAESTAYAEILLAADCLEVAERLAAEAVESLGAAPDGGWTGVDVIKADRVTPEQFASWLEESAPGSKRSVAAAKVRQAATIEPGIYDVRWLVAPGEDKAA